MSGKRSLYYRELKLVINEDIDGGLNITIIEKNSLDGSQKMTDKISDEDYRNVMGLIHNFDMGFREMQEHYGEV